MVYKLSLFVMDGRDFAGQLAPRKAAWLRGEESMAHGLSQAPRHQQRSLPHFIVFEDGTAHHRNFPPSCFYPP